MKNVFVLYERAGLESGRRLGNELIEKQTSGYSFLKGRLSRYNEQARQTKFDFIINVGYAANIDGKKAVILNNPQAIATSSNKRGARIKFKEFEIPAPNLWLSSKEIPKNAYPVIGRITRHTQGRGFWFCKDSKAAIAAEKAGATHFLKFIEDTREFRIHVAAPHHNLKKLNVDDYAVFKTSEKLPKPGVKNPDPTIKNHDNGWVFSHPKDSSSATIRDLRDVARKAIAKFGLHWGAVDIIVSNKSDMPYVLEINSAPCLTDEQSDTIDKYVEIVSGLVGMGNSTTRIRKQETPAVETKKLKALLSRSL